jgi:eukaryotic-like serine/threonine-protein kinase
VESIVPGAVIDGFTVGPLCFTGGAALLYAVTHPDHPDELLMKVPRIGVEQPTESLIGFETECNIMPTLQGACAPRFITAGPIDEVPYLVMERVPGHSLSDWLKPELVGPGELARLGAAVARAASSLHRQDVIHLDIKPDNIIIRPTGEATLIDYGFSHHAYFPDLFSDGSRSGVGSWPYISPEQLDGVRTDARSDQFAIGASLYEVAVGRLPFDVPQTAREARNRAWVEPAPPRALVPDFPPWLQEVILRCLEPDPAARYASCAQLAQALAQPETVELTARAERVTTPGFFGQLRRGWRYRGKSQGPVSAPRRQIAAAPLILVAVDTEVESPGLLQALGDATQRALLRSPESRLACLTVITDGAVEEKGSSESERFHQYRVRLHHWVRRFGLPERRLSLHVFATSDPARVIVEFARANHCDVVLVGASHERGLRKTVMTRIAEDAPCSVHIIRPVDYEGAAPAATGVGAGPASTSPPQGAPEQDAGAALGSGPSPA